MDQDSVIVRCGHCGAKNRIPRGRMQDRAVCGRCKSSLSIGPDLDKPVDITDNTFDSEVLSSSMPVLVDCWAPWCGPCRMVGPVLEQLAREYAGRVKIAKLNVDENPRIASRYSIRSIPTMLLFNRGELANTMVGALPKQEIERQLRSIL
ncbi:MAG: thioredoxin TrxC [Candidatus Desulfacyla sp.]